MSVLIFMNEASANSRTVPFRAFLSNGTSPDTGLSNDSVLMIKPSGATFTPNVLVQAAHAAQGMYYVTLNQSDVSLCGTNALYYTQGDFPQHIANISVVSFNPYDGVRIGITALPNAAAAASGGLLVFGTGTGAINPSSGSVDAQYLDLSSKLTVGVANIKAQTYSGVTVGSLATIPAGDYSSSITFGVAAIKAGTYSGVTVGSLATIPAGDYSSSITFGVGTIKAGTYSGVTVGINNIAAGGYSGVTISGVTASNVLDKSGYGVTSIAAGTYSGVTVGSAATILAGTYSGVTVGVNNLAAGNYSGVTISGVTASNVLDKTGYALAAGDFSSTITMGVSTLKAGTITTASIAAAALDSTVFATNAEQAFADRLLLRSIAGGADSGRTVGTALYLLRNKVDATGSVGTVYQTDDATSAWTFSATTAPGAINQLTPGS